MKSCKKNDKIIIAINDLTVGGAQKLVVDQIKGWGGLSNLHLVVLFTFTNKKTLYSELPDSLTVHQFSFKSWHDFQSWWGMITLLSSLNPKVVISHLFFTNTVMRVLKILFWYRIIIVEHNTYDNLSLLHKKINKFLSFGTNSIVAVSNTVKEFISINEGITKSRIKVIYNGINFNELKKALIKSKINRKNLGYNQDDIILINASRLTHQKNHEGLLQVFKILSEKEPRVRLIIAGDGSLRSKLEKLVVSLKITKKVRFLGMLDQETLYQYYKLSDAFISYSIREGFSLAFIEAMFFGIPLITTAVSGPNEYIQEPLNGVLLSGTNLHYDCNKIYEFLSVPNTDKIKRFCKETALSFDIKDNIESYKQLIL